MKPGSFTYFTYFFSLIYTTFLSHQSLPVPVLEKHSLRVASILYLRRTPLITPMQPHRLASPASQWFCRQNDSAGDCNDIDLVMVVIVMISLW